MKIGFNSYLVMDKRGEIDSLLTWIIASFILGFSLFVFMALVFAISSGKTFFGDSEIILSESSYELDTSRDFFSLLGKQVDIDGERFKVIDAIYEGLDKEGKFIEEDQMELVSFISSELEELCDYEIEVPGGYFNGKGYYRSTSIDIDFVSQLSDRQLERYSDQKGEFLSKDFVVVYDGVYEGEIIEVRMVKYRDCLE